jgi:hypothetical protein
MKSYFLKFLHRPVIDIGATLLFLSQEICEVVHIEASLLDLLSEVVLFLLQLEHI